MGPGLVLLVLMESNGCFSGSSAVFHWAPSLCSCGFTSGEVVYGAQSVDLP